MTGESLIKQFTEIAGQYPGNIAIKYRRQDVTYEQLDRRSNRLANYFHRQNPDSSHVVVLMDRSAGLVVSLVGLMKCGLVFIPVDPLTPGNRVKKILEETGSQWVITSRRYFEKFKDILRDAGNPRVLLMEEDGDSPDSPVDGNTSVLDGDIASETPDVTKRDNKHCYIFFTSGSTGTPKGVLGKEKSLAHFIRWEIQEFGIDAGCKVSQLTSPSFDAVLRDIFVPLCTGGQCCIPDYEIVLTPVRLIDWMDENQVNLVHTVPSLFKSFTAALDDSSRLRHLKYILMSGELLRGKDVRPFFNLFDGRIQLVNFYGATETTLIKMFYRISAKDAALPVVPVGKSMPGCQVMVLDGNMRPCRAGKKGEIYIRTPYASAGYFNDRDLTRKVFLKNPFNDNPRDLIYKTGDIGRVLPDKNIEVLGRMDHQVKIRGIRVEPGEIENLLLNFEGVQEAVVTARDTGETGNGDKQLCAYFVSGNPIGVSELRDHMAKDLHESLVPSHFIRVPRIPLNTIGKVDRDKLPAPGGHSPSGDYIAPRTPMEEKMVELWAEILGKDKNTIGIHSDFFSLGGHSLKAADLLGGIHKEFKVEIPLARLFHEPTIEEICVYIGKLARSEHYDILPAPPEDYYPLSPAQKRLYVLQLMNVKSTAYNMPRLFQLGAEPHLEKIRDIFTQLIKRHESLRTAFVFIDGEPMQKILPAAEVDFSVRYFNPEEEGKSVSGVINDFVRPFDLSGAPLIRVGLIETGDNRRVLMVDMHHIISDGISQVILEKEFAALDRGVSLDELKLQYKDFSHWRNSEKVRTAVREQENYWLSEFGGEIHALELPIDYLRPRERSFEGKSVQFELDEENTHELKEITREHGGTLFMLLLALYNIFLFKIGNQSEVVVGTPVSGRPHPDLQPVIGMFVNTLALKNEVDSRLSFSGFFKRLIRKTLASFENQDYPFEDLVDKAAVKRDTGRNPLFDVVFVFQNMDLETGNLETGDNESAGEPGLEVEQTTFRFEESNAKFDLTLTAIEAGGKLLFKFQYWARLFKPATIERFIRYFRQVVSSAIQNPDREIFEIEVISKQEKERLLHNFNNTDAGYPEGKTIHRLFREQVEKSPRNPAVVYHDEELTYEELDRKSGSLAALLVEKGVGPDTITALLTEPSPDMIVAIMGVLKAGGAYLPVSPDYPSERIEYMLKDSGAPVILTTGKHRDTIPSGCDTVYLDNPATYRADAPPAADTAGPRNLAYVIYTSGTTGRPKGVLIEHRNVVRLLFNDRNLFDFNHDDVWTMFHSYCFDFSVWEMYGALLNGARLVIVPPGAARDPGVYLRLLIEHRVTVINQTPAAFYNLLKEEAKQPETNLSARYVIFGGDALAPVKLRPWKDRYPGCRLINMYGITETTVHVTFKEIGENEINNNISNIGQPIPTLRTYIMDRRQRLLPEGAAGEICVGGHGVGRGYLNRPGLTADKFVENPYNKDERLYLSGDMARFLEDGEMVYMGRIDQQVKIRGFRIEPGEIQDRMLHYDGIKEAIVLPVKNTADDTGYNALCAYFTAQGNIEAPALRDYLKGVLPDYMVPSFFVAVDSFPLTPNGKLDRKALPAPSGIVSKDFVAPGTDKEKVIAGIWKNILKLETIGVNENFFELGGTSLDIVRVSQEIENELEIKIPVLNLFRYPTIRELTRSMSPPGQNAGPGNGETVQKEQKEVLDKKKERMLNTLRKRRRM